MNHPLSYHMHNSCNYGKERHLWTHCACVVMRWSFNLLGWDESLWQWQIQIIFCGNMHIVVEFGHLQFEFWIEALDRLLVLGQICFPRWFTITLDWVTSMLMVARVYPLIHQFKRSQLWGFFDTWWVKHECFFIVLQVLAIQQVSNPLMNMNCSYSSKF